MKQLTNTALLCVVACAAFGCTNEHGLNLDIVARDPVPAEVVSWELRLFNIEATAACPSASDVASAARVGRLAHAQTFTDVGMALGELPEGQWAFAVVGRDESCGVRSYGCTSVTIGRDTFSPIVIEVDTVVDVTELCGCRACEMGACTPVQLECD